MVTGTFHKGSGLGNQLFRYIMTRVLALDNGYDFGMWSPELFKGASFMNLDMGVNPVNEIEYTLNWNKFDEKKVVENGIDIRGYDPEVNFVQDNTIIDGEFQDERYFRHRLAEVGEWLKVEPLDIQDDICVINFRGGEYVGIPDLFLPKSYWENAVNMVKDLNPAVKFEVHTDDPVMAKEFFAYYPIIRDLEENWRAIRCACYLILSNSSFAILPALLNEKARCIIAPRHWARHNKKVWALPQNYYKKFTYI